MIQTSVSDKVCLLAVEAWNDITGEEFTMTDVIYVKVGWPYIEIKFAGTPCVKCLRIDTLNKYGKKFDEERLKEYIEGK